jgi:fused signal recognition particle receptor
MALFDFIKKENWLSKLREKLLKPAKLFSRILLLFDSPEINYSEIERQLLDVDIDYQTTSNIIEKIKSSAKTQKIDSKTAKEIIREQMLAILQTSYKGFDLTNYDNDKQKVVLFCGINGGGKTTSIAKISSLFKKRYRILIVGCDSFRAAANDQLNEWCKRLNLELFDSKSAETDKQQTIAYKALEHATNNNYELVLIDTSGRMATSTNLMEELKAVTSTISKYNSNCPQEIILVLDGTQGQSILTQIEDFSKFVKITGLIVTKLDGVSKGGIIISISRKFKLPIYFIGIGEKDQDITYFNPEEFVDTILG